MRTTSLPISAASFEKIFRRSVMTRVTRSQRYSFADELSAAGEKYPDPVGWRKIARKAIEKNVLGDALRRAIVSLRIQYKEALFVHDVKNLDTDETAWVLGVTTGAVRVRLRRARMQIREALASSLRGA